MKLLKRLATAAVLALALAFGAPAAASAEPTTPTVQHEQDRCFIVIYIGSTIDGIVVDENDEVVGIIVTDHYLVGEVPCPNEA